jgi:hypothetical protein
MLQLIEFHKPFEFISQSQMTPAFRSEHALHHTANTLLVQRSVCPAQPKKVSGFSLDLFDRFHLD